MHGSVSRINRCVTTTAVLVLVLATMMAAGRGDDPRPPADAPFGVEGESQPRLSRRAQRRAARRRGTSERTTDESRADAERVARPEPAGAGLPPTSLIAHRDQPYCEAPRPCQRFDIYLPSGCDGSLPLVVWIHGETWRTGTKDDCPITWLTGEGYAVASLGYRLSSEATFPAQLDDCLAGLATIERDAEIWGIDRDRICVAGSAAGGHLAALVGLWNEAAADQPLPHVAAVGAFAAPTHLTSLGPAHDRSGSPASLLVGGPLPEFREAAQRASPLAHVAPDSPPVLLVHGRADTVVPPEQSVRLDAALRAAGGSSHLVMLDGVGHDLSLARGTAAGVALLEFLDRTLGPGGVGR